jgi:hypothetical protein
MDISTTKVHWSALIELGKATILLQRSRDLLVLAHGPSQSSAALDILAGAAGAQLKALGAQLVAEAQSADPETAAFVALLMDRLHAPGPPEQPPAEPAETERRHE